MFVVLSVFLNLFRFNKAYILNELVVVIVIIDRVAKHFCDTVPLPRTFTKVSSNSIVGCKLYGWSDLAYLLCKVLGLCL